MRELAAVAVRHRDEERAPVAPGLEPGLRDAGELLAQDVRVGARRGPQAVPVDLLEEIPVRWSSLLSLRVAGVVDAGAVGRPGRAAAPGREAGAGDDLAQRFPGARLEEIERSILAPALRHRHRDLAAVEGRDVPVDGQRTLPPAYVRIHHHPLARGIVGRLQGDEQRLLQGRLVLQGEERPGAVLDVVVARGRLRVQGLQPIAQRGPAGQRVEMGAGRPVLGFHPGPHLGARRVFEPAVVLDDGDAVVGIGRRPLAGGRPFGAGREHGRSQYGHGENADKRSSGHVHLRRGCQNLGKNRLRSGVAGLAGPSPSASRASRWFGDSSRTLRNIAVARLWRPPVR